MKSPIIPVVILAVILSACSTTTHRERTTMNLADLTALIDEDNPKEAYELLLDNEDTGFLNSSICYYRVYSKDQIQCWPRKYHESSRAEEYKTSVRFLANVKECSSVPKEEMRKCLSDKYPGYGNEYYLDSACGTIGGGDLVTLADGVSKVWEPMKIFRFHACN